MISSKIKFAFLAFSTSFLFAMLLIYLYGATFQHDRYWHGTLLKVQKTEAAIIANLLGDQSFKHLLTLDRTQLHQLFKPLDRKLLIEIVNNGTLFFDNTEHKFTKSTLIQEITHNNTSLKISNYSPPSWNSIFLKWMTRPGRWLSPSFDYITIPFLLFFIIFLCISYALGWRVRSKHLSDHVLEMMHDYPGTKR